MNLLCAFRQDKPESRLDFFRSFTIVTLWDMLKLDAQDFIDICMRLERGSTFIEVTFAHGVDDEEIPLPSWFHDNLVALSDNLVAMGLRMSNLSARRLVDFVEKDDKKMASKLRPFFDKLGERIKDELEGKTFLVMPPSREKYYELEGTILGDHVLTKLAKLKLREDAEEAGNCFAVGRHTACVFHLMRVMERVVQSLGKKLRVRFNPERDTWNKILKRAKDEIDKLPEASPRQIRRKAKFQNIYLDLGAVKDAWRNPTMHPRATYTEEQAHQVIDKVKNLINDFAELR